MGISAVYTTAGTHVAFGRVNGNHGDKYEHHLLLVVGEMHCNKANVI